MIAETKRLILRELTPKDAIHFFELNNDPEVLKHTGDQPFKDVLDAEDFLNKYTHYAENGFGRWAVIRKADDEFLGWCGLKMHTENQYVDLGFRFFRNYWGMGYATEAAQLSVEIGFNQFNLKEIIGRTSRQNFGSIRVLEKIGMKYFKEDECQGIEDAMYFKLKKSF